MNYIGSKKSLLEFLEQSIYKVVNKDSFTFLDLFAGTGIVGQHFKKLGNKIIANHLQYYSFALNKNYIENHKPLKFLKLKKEILDLEKSKIDNRQDIVCDHLDNLSLKEGFIYNNYCLGGTKNKEYERLYFSDENGKKVDTIRQKIEEWKEKNY